jgi:hypothetical protein
MGNFMYRRNWLKTLVGSLLAVALIAFFASTVAPLKAHAAALSTPTNYCGAQPNDANCDGQQPEAQGCTFDASVLKTVPIISGTQTLGEVEFVYSSHCLSAWTRTISNQPATLYAQIIRSDGLSYSMTNNNVTKVHTAMIFASKPLRICGSINGVSACG